MRNLADNNLFGGLRVEYSYKKVPCQSHSSARKHEMQKHFFLNLSTCTMSSFTRIYLIYSLCLLAKGAINVHDVLKYKFLWSQCSGRHYLLGLFNISLQECVFECDIRANCKAVNYRRHMQKCVLLKEDKIIPRSDKSQRLCVYLRMAQIEKSYIPVSFRKTQREVSKVGNNRNIYDDIRKTP